MAELESLEDRLASLTRRVSAHAIGDEQALAMRNGTVLSQINHLGQQVEHLSGQIAGYKRLNDLYEENRELLSHHALESLANASASVTRNSGAYSDSSTGGTTSGAGNPSATRDHPSELKRAVLLSAEDQIDRLCADLEQLKRLSGSTASLTDPQVAGELVDHLTKAEHQGQETADLVMAFHWRVHQLLQQYKSLMQLLSAKLVAYDSLLQSLEANKTQ